MIFIGFGFGEENANPKTKTNKSIGRTSNMSSRKASSVCPCLGRRGQAWHFPCFGRFVFLERGCSRRHWKKNISLCFVFSSSYRYICPDGPYEVERGGSWYQVPGTQRWEAAWFFSCYFRSSYFMVGLRYNNNRVQQQYYPTFGISLASLLFFCGA